MKIIGILLFFGIPLLIIGVGIFLKKARNLFKFNQDDKGTFIIGTGLVIFCTVLLCVILFNVGIYSEIINYKVQYDYYEKQGETFFKSPINKSKFIMDQYWNKTILDIFIPDDVNEIE